MFDVTILSTYTFNFAWMSKKYVRERDRDRDRYWKIKRQINK